MKSNTDCYNKIFSHIYVERDAFKYDYAKAILERFKTSEKIIIDSYLDVFTKGRSFFYQKKSLGLILAVKREDSIYKGADVCEDFGNKNFYYTSSVMNCIYDCEYCYLQGMYPSANIVLFVNICDTFSELEALLKNQSVYLCVSYDTDILAFERIFNLTEQWIKFTEKHENLKIEIRTKSNCFHTLKNIGFVPNVIFAWTLSPDFVTNNFEHKAPSLKKRIEDMKLAIEAGYKIRLCIDPIIYVRDFEKIYSGLIDYLFEQISESDILDISIGTFRVNKDYFKRMKKQRFDSIILSYPFVTKGGVCGYEDDLINRMINFVYKKLLAHVPESKIFLYSKRLSQ